MQGSAEGIDTVRLDGIGACGAKIWVASAKGEVLPRKRGSAELGVVYLNDLHGSPGVVARQWQQQREVVRQSGMACLGLFGGDALGGGTLWDVGMDTPSPRAYSWEWLAELGVDCAVPGNHDLDWGLDAFVAASREFAQIRLVLSNAARGCVLEQVTHRYVILEWEHCVIGLLGALTIEQTAEGRSHLLDPVTTLQKLAQWLRPQVDGLIMMCHLPDAEDVSCESEGRLIRAFADDQCVLLTGAHRHFEVPCREAGWQRGNYLQSGQQGKLLGEARLHGGHWQVRNSAVNGDPSEPADGRFHELLRLDCERRGTIRMRAHGYAEEEPWRTGYRGECAHLNAVCDLLHAAVGSPAGTLSAVCVRIFGRQLFTEEMDTADWYACLPYGDRLYRITVPENTLWDLLTANAQRLMMQDSYMESRGMLHFSHHLRYRVSLMGKADAPEITWIELFGEQLKRNRSPELTLLTHAYVAEGMAGYEAVFESCGITRFARKPAPLMGPIRQLLWEYLRRNADGPNAAMQCDQRLQVDRL